MSKRQVYAFCVLCNKEIRPLRKQTQRYCSVACRRQGIWYAHAYPEPTHCPICCVWFTPVHFWRGKRTGNRRATCSEPCRKLYLYPRRRSFAGKNNPQWTGNVTNRSYRGVGWEKQAAKARKRAKDCCERCGKTQEANGRRLDVHHKIRFFNFTNSQEANKLSNLIALCQSCHRRADMEERHNTQIPLFGFVPGLKPRKKKAKK
jgi:HNH endonuclease